MNKKNIFRLIIALTLLIVGFVYFVINGGYLNNAKEQSMVMIRGHAIKIETVKDEKAKALGLSRRQSLCGDCGMLFVFDKPGKYSFWMKDMQFALDLLWIRDGRVVFMKKNVPPDFAATITPTENANQVLEINAETVDGFGIKVGDKVKLK